jgi:hypothetical protein
MPYETIALCFFCFSMGTCAGVLLMGTLIGNRDRMTN